MTAARRVDPPWLRMGAGAAMLAAATAVARSHVIHPAEEHAFRSVNGLPRALFAPSFVLMQAGNYVTVLVATGALAATGRRRAAVCTLGAGTASWVACKVIKARTRRGRPSAHLELVTMLGPADTGLGFPSGHSAVAVTLAGALSPQLPPALRPVVWGWAATVGASRLYVGAHLPLDVVGGASIGLAVGALGGWLAADPDLRPVPG